MHFKKSCENPSLTKMDIIIDFYRSFIDHFGRITHKSVGECCIKFHNYFNLFVFFQFLIKIKLNSSN